MTKIVIKKSGYNILTILCDFIQFKLIDILNAIKLDKINLIFSNIGSNVFGLKEHRVL